MVCLSLSVCVCQYCVSWPCVVLWSVRQLCDWMSSDVWSSLSLSSLVSPAAAHMTCAELNACLSWSVHSVSLTAAHSQPLMLVGVLELNSSHATLQIKDQTQTLDCVCVQTDQSGATTNSNISTAWLGKPMTSLLFVIYYIVFLLYCCCCCFLKD